MKVISIQFLVFILLFFIISCTEKEDVAILPALTTSAITDLLGGNATSGGDISSDGGYTVTARGVCWSTSTDPTLADSTTIDGTGIGVFTSSITGLAVNTTYYVRAYATNSIGTRFGNELSFTADAIIGDLYEGGIVAYILQSGDPGYDTSVPHGIIVPITDQSTGASWGCSLDTPEGINISGAIGTAIGTGQQNTIDILEGCSETGIAAKICADLALNGYTDWYLPSKDELYKLYLNKAAIDAAAISIGGTSFRYEYWSSTQHIGSCVPPLPYYPQDCAWIQSFTDGEQELFPKYLSQNVRAVRSF